jgi:hypothetical protein
MGVIRLPDGIFKVQEYVNAQAKRTDWLVQRRPRLTQFMKLAVEHIVLVVKITLQC